jgi:general secretion pathway protein H
VRTTCPAVASGRQRAFTLIEILVVITIIAVIIGVVVLSVHVTGRDSELHKESKRLNALIAMAREQAEMQVRDFGLYLEDHGYRFMVFDPRRQLWIDAEERELRERNLPDGLVLSLVLEGREAILAPPIGNMPPAPQVLLYASGDLSLFDITMKREKTDHHAEIRVAETGAVEFNDVDHMPAAIQ